MASVHFRVDEVTATRFEGGLVEHLAGGLDVSGTFEITICPDVVRGRRSSRPPDL